MLKFYVKMGAKITKIHRVTKLQQLICRVYIQNKTEKRATAKTGAEKDVKNLMNKSLFVRVCMNPLHFIETKLLYDEEKTMKSVNNPLLRI